MEFEWDDDKSLETQRLRGFGFDLVLRFDWSTAQITTDDRFDYGEERFRARGLIDRRLYILVFSLRSERLRVIYLRKANARERRAYAVESQSPK